MTRDEKLQLAWSFWQLQSEGRMEAALALLDDAGNYRPNGMQSWEDIPMHEVKRFFRIMGERMPLKFEYLDAVVDNDVVVLEFTCYAEIPDGGGIYDQRYCMMMTLNGNKIVRIREFLDTEMEHALVRYLWPEVVDRPIKYGRALGAKPTPPLASAVPANSGSH